MGKTMQLCKVRLKTGEVAAGVTAAAHVILLSGVQSLADLLHSEKPLDLAQELLRQSTRMLPLGDVRLLAPVDQQEIWAAGVTYKRSQEARERESVGAARFYDLVYTAARPELFFKALPARVAGPNDKVRIRRDSQWSVPEPELALVISPRMHIAGYTIGNDMSARDIEGENPLYLPQAKIYDRSCALGPVITLVDSLPPPDQVAIHMTIERQGKSIFDGTTRLSAMARPLTDLADWLGRETTFPHGAVLLTGTGIVPPDDFALAEGDLVNIEITGIGRLSNLVERG